MTRAGRAVLSALEGQAGFLSAQEIHARLRAAGSTVGLTSVYRALQALRDSAEVDEQRAAAGELGYRRCRTPSHHHHLTCVSCRATVEIEATSVERWIDTVAQRHDFELSGHTVDLLGTCARCRSTAGG